MSQAIDAYYTITASSEFQERERLRAKARHDEAQALYNAKRIAAKEQSLEIAQKLLGLGLSLEQISETTGLSLEEVEALRP